VRQYRRAVTVATGIAAVAGLGFMFAGPALAHVTADAPGATQGGYATITFKVPTESDTASTVGLKVQLPTDNPIASVSIQPKAGWTYTVKKAKPATPLSNDDGPITEIITEIDWKAAAGNPGIKPGEFDGFVISAGPLPKVETVTFKVVQEYSDGEVVSWIETPASGSSAEPAHPPPTIALAAATGTADLHATPSASPSAAAADRNANKQDGTSGLSVAAFIVGLLGLLLAIVAFCWILTVGTKLRKGSSKA
jgi:uncharacterized protein YcnI